MSRAAALILFATLASCGTKEPQKSKEEIDAEVAVLIKISELESRVIDLERETTMQGRTIRALGKEADRVSGFVPAAHAILTGSTAKGEAISTDYSSMSRCLAARQAILEEGRRACAGREPEDSTRSIIYGECSKPQASCSRK